MTARSADPLLARQIAVLYLLYLEKQVDPELLTPDHGQGQCHRENVQWLSRERERPHLDRQRGAPRAQGVARVRTSARPSGKAARGSARSSRQSSRRSSSCETRPRPSWALPITTRCNSISPSSRRSKSSSSSTSSTRSPAEPFGKLKSEIDAKLAEQCGVTVDELRPWHYHDPFFQESPAIFAADFDAVYAKVDILKLCRDFYAGIGLPIDDVIARSDLYEKPGKSPHAFCTDIDRAGRRARAGQHRAQRVLDGHHAARARALGLQQQEHSVQGPLRAREARRTS